MVTGHALLSVEGGELRKFTEMWDIAVKNEPFTPCPKGYHQANKPTFQISYGGKLIACKMVTFSNGWPLFDYLKSRLILISDPTVVTPVFNIRKILDIVGIWNPTISNPETFEILTSRRYKSNGQALAIIASSNHSKFWLFCPDFKWF